MRSLTTLSIALMLAAGATTGAMAQTFTATNSANVGSSESSSNSSLSAKFDSTNPSDGRFAVIDVSGVEVSPAPVISLTLTFTEFSGKYAQSGPLNFFLTSDTTPLVGDGSERFTYKRDNQTDGIGTQLGALALLGTRQFTALPYVKGKTTAARVSYTFTLTPAQQSALVADIKAGDIRIALGVSSGAETETEFYGATHSAMTAIELTLNTQ